MLVIVETSVDECLHLDCISSYRKEGLDLRDQSPTAWPWDEGQERRNGGVEDDVFMAAYLSDWKDSDTSE